MFHKSKSVKPKGKRGRNDPSFHPAFDNNSDNLSVSDISKIEENDEKRRPLTTNLQTLTSPGSPEVRHARKKSMMKRANSETELDIQVLIG